jgi:hypothetical protein
MILVSTQATAAPPLPPISADQYAQMCATGAVNMPVPHGESDLKDNPKLQAYCQCFATKFAARAEALLRNPGAPPPPISEAIEQREMRNGCRKQLGLPLLNFPPITVPAAGAGVGRDALSAVAPANAEKEAPAASDAAVAVPEGIYLGYYQEDPATNPEDPTMGSVYLNLPKGDSSFSGKMFFTYVGCQDTNVGTISGTKAATSLKGEWTGTVDGTSQRGSFSGSWLLGNIYSGTYTVAGGKQHIDIPSCISYYIAPDGTFELFPVGQKLPQNFALSIQGGTLTWSPPTGALMTLIFVLDPAIAGNGASNATVWQTLIQGAQSRARLTDAPLAHGHQYVVAIASVNSRHERVAFGSIPYRSP